MTVALPDQDTDTARQILERAQLEPPCENPEGCERPAAWILHITNKPCGCRFHILSCTRCKDHVIEAQANDERRRRWRCLRCGDEQGPHPYRDSREVDVEPLR